MPQQPKQLEEYAKKRDFDATPEPSAAKRIATAKSRRRAKPLAFVIQLHRATRLHYDFRLEVDGVLASWAVPKGPSLDPTDKRLAMHVEDHPFDYRTFEGVIPVGHYGAGEVIVWDQGTYQLADGRDPRVEIDNGKIKFILNGEKLKGEFTLVKIRAHAGESGEPWLLVKDKDEFVDLKWRVESVPASVQSDLTLAQLAKRKNLRERHSNPTFDKTSAATTKKSKRSVTLPKNVSPMLATLVAEAFDDERWLFEIKWDGFRSLATIREDRTVELLSRNGNDLLQKFPELAHIGDAFSSLPVIVDGEIVSLDEKGRSSFQRLQNRIESSRVKRSSNASSLTYVVFDLLFADGRDLRNEPLAERKELLEKILRPTSHVLLSKHIFGRGKELFNLAAVEQLEGIIGKRRDSKYVGRRSRDWVKIKARAEQEFVIGGWTEPRGSRASFGALLLGTYEGKTLSYVGRVGTGFDVKNLSRIMQLLKPLEIDRSPFKPAPPADKETHFVKPELVAQVRFTEWTDDGILRHPAFLGLRDDKKASEVVREQSLAIDRVPEKKSHKKNVST